MSEVLAQTEFGTVQLVKEYTVDVVTTIWDHIPSLPSINELEIPSFSDINFNALPRSRPILINFVILLLSYVLCRRYGINYLIFLLFVFVYCLYEYLDYECHRVSTYLYYVSLSIFLDFNVNVNKFQLFILTQRKLSDQITFLLYFFSQRIELNEAVDFIYGKEKNPCLSHTKMNWYDWLLGKDSRSACRDFLE